GELEQIIHVLENDDCSVHLRKPHYSQAEYEDLLQAIPAEYHSRIVITDYYFLHTKYSVRGLHFPSAKRTVAQSIQFKGTKSTSCHSIEELQAIDGQFDYAFLSPVFPSISKQDYKADWDMQNVEEYLHTTRKTNVIALGGIDAGNISMIEKWGFDGYALLGSVWENSKN
ncbi:MAG: thiamine phosphate synthase, partial [Bacteroidales bacterium]